MVKISDLYGEPHELAALLEYQDEAVVSREIIKKDVGTVTLFAFDAGQGLSEHTAPYDALVYVADGEAEVRIAADTKIVGMGQIIILPAGVPHAIQAKQRFKMVLVMIKA